MVPQQILRIFVSSPEDVPQERLSARHLIQETLPAEAFIRDRVALQLVSWDGPEGPIAMPASLTPQEAINRARPKPSECDIVVVIFWARMGTPLPSTHCKPTGERYLSGTEWEYEDAMAAARSTGRPTVLLYRRTDPPPTALTDLKDPKPPTEHDPSKAVEQFFARFSNPDGSRNGHYHTYATPEEFTRQLHRHLRDTIEILLRPQAPLARSAAVSSFQSRIEAFLGEYLQSETGPVPFGGRDLQLAHLDAWLEDSTASSRYLITAPAGRGKSALLVRWIERLQRNGKLADASSADPTAWHLVFVPISMRFGTNAPHVFYHALAERLAAIQAEVLTTPPADAAGHYADNVRRLLSVLGKSAKRVLVVLDGVDEALRGEFDATIFPRLLPATIRIVASARWLYGDHDYAGWRQRLGWDSGVRCESIDLAVLNADEIGQVLISMGAPLDVAAMDPEVVTRLAQLTEGEPLLLYYYALDLWQQGAATPRITRQDLDGLSPGFGPYFDRWLESQQRAWREAGEQVDQRDVDAVLMVLAFACGPLEGRDLITLVRCLREANTAIIPSQLLEPLRRFVIGDGSRERGYVLSHPKIGEHFQSSRYRDARGLLEDTFADWGRRVLREANRPPEHATDVPRYVLQFHRRHLQAARAPYTDFLAAVEDGWRRAWEHFEGSQQGFCSDVRAAWEAARAIRPLHDPCGQIRCMLALSSIRSLGHDIPGVLIAAATRHRVLSVRQALHLASFMRDRSEYASTLARVASESEQDPARQRELLEEVLAQAEAGPQALRTLVRIAPHVLPDQRMPLLARIRRVLQATLQHSAHHRRFELMHDDNNTLQVEVFARLAAVWKGSDLEQVCAAARSIGEATLGGALIAFRNPQNSEVILRGSLALVRFAFEDEGFRAQTLAGMADWLAPEGQLEALEIAEGIPDLKARAIALVGLCQTLHVSYLMEGARALHRLLVTKGRAPSLPPRSQRLRAAAVLTAGMLSFGTGTPNRLRPAIQEACIQFAPQRYLVKPEPTTSMFSSRGWDEPGHSVRPATVRGALAEAKRLGNRLERAEQLRSIADQLSPNELVEALEVAKSVGDGAERVAVLLAIAACLQGDQHHEALIAAARAAKSIPDPEAKVAQLRAVLKRMPPQVREETLEEAHRVAEHIPNAAGRAQALSALASHLTGAARRAALDVSLRTLDELEGHDTLATTLCEVMGHFPDPERWALVTRVIKLAKATVDLDQQGRLLSALGPHGSDEQLWEVYALGCAIQNPNARARCLAALAGSLPSDLREPALEGAMTAAREVGNLGARADALVEVARHLNGNQRSWVLDQALAAARQMTGGHAQVVVLTHLAPHLSTEQLTLALEVARDAANEIGAEEVRALALTRLLAMLEGKHSDLLEQDAFQAAQKVADPSTRMAALRRIAKFGQAAQAEEALQSALTLATSRADAYDRADALGGISDMLTGEQWDAALLALLKTGEELPRPELLNALRAFIPRLYELEGEAALLKLQRAVVDTGTWYP